MDLLAWYKQRGLKFVYKRGKDLLSRYGIRPHAGTRRITECVETMGSLGCSPTLFTPGKVVERYPQFIQNLQKLGAEIAVHSYEHVNLTHLPITEAENQLRRAIQVFQSFGIENHGFRCPYLAHSDKLLEALPSEMFRYSSNKAIFWDPFDHQDTSQKGLFFNTLEKFYNAKNSSEYINFPYPHSSLLEIPICVPDDLQIYDGFNLHDEGFTRIWLQFLDHTYKRGELLTLIFHTELASSHRQPFIELIKYANQQQPSVWIARLKDIYQWWVEKSRFTVNVHSELENLQLSFDCSPRATILVRNVRLGESSQAWDGRYSVVRSRTLEVPANPRPFIGISDDLPANINTFLQNQGYILEHGPIARTCALTIDSSILAAHPTEVELVNFIETTQTPLVRFWRWPDEAKSAMSLTGDLDAISLFDYISRLFPSNLNAKGNK
jgi:peptidoglycan/xylan/chitin deacetylase (PgdA/CDA1 family)